MQFVGRLNATTPVYTNAADLIYMFLNRLTYMIPRKLDPYTRLPNDQYESKVAEMKRTLGEKNGVVVYFDAESREWFLPSLKDLETNTGLRMISRESDRVIFFCVSTLDTRVILWLGLAITGFVPPSSYLRKAKSVDLRQGDNLVVVMFMVVVSYAAMLSLSVTFLDAQIPVDSRTLSPIYVPSMILLVALLIRLVLMTASGLKARLLVSTCLALLLGAQLQVSANWLQFNYQNGIGYADRSWRESQTLNRLKTGDACNDAFLGCVGRFVYVTSKAAVMVPRKTHPDTNLPNQHYVGQTAELRRRLKDESGLLVYLDRVAWRWYLPAAEGLERTLGLHVLARENDGVIYQAR